MTDGNWNTEAPAAKKGWPLWAKISLGCCSGCVLVFILATVTCVSGAHWISKHGVPEALDRAVGSAFLDKAWADMDRAVKALRTEAGTKAMYHANPGLSENFASEEDFLKAAEEWRTRLGDFPDRRPALGTLIRGNKGSHHFNINTQNDRTRIEYQIPNGGMLYLDVESGKFVDVRVE